MVSVTGKQVADAVFNDVEKFFYYKEKFLIKRECNSSCRQHASIKGVGTNSRIRLSLDFCNFEISNLDDLFFVTIILSHEISHYLNKHNDHKDKDEIDITALETWADFYGAKLFMTIITFGKRTKALMGKFSERIEQNLVLPSIGRAMGELYRTIYLPNVDERYPPAIERVGIFKSGVTSFFYRAYDEFKPRWTLHVLNTLVENSGLLELLGEHDPDWDRISGVSDRSSEIHKSLQNQESAITKGLKPQYLRFLVTNYMLKPEDIQKRKERLSQQMQSLGIDFG